MTARPTRLLSWWQQRTLRTRLVVLSIVPLTVALVTGTVALVVLFTAGRVRDLDQQTHREADSLAALTGTEQLTTPLPVPPGSPLLAQVINVSGTVLAASPSASLVLPLVQPASGRLVRRDFTENDNSYGSVPLRVHQEPAVLGTEPVLIVVAAPLSDVRRALQSLQVVAFVLVPALIASVSALEWAVIGLTLRPVERLRAAAAALAAPEHPSPEYPAPERAGPERPEHRRADAGRPSGLDFDEISLPVGRGDDEITRLGHTLNELLRRLYGSMAQQRSFLLDAAHELRSPLASMRLQLDVASTHPALLSTEQLAGELTTEIDRLTRLTDDLLILGRLDADVARRRTAVNLTQLAGADGPSVTVLGDHDDLERLVRNITDNAHRYGDTVWITVSEQQGQAVLDVDDDGPGIAPADRERVFQRWTRLSLARDRDTGGSGLGLALVRKIAHAHSGDVTIQDSPLGGTRVRVRLPGVPGQ